VLAYVLLAVAQAIGLLLIPFGVPGIWLQLAALGLFGWWTRFSEIGAIPIGILVTLALGAELVKLLAMRGRVDDRVRRRVGLGGLAGSGFGAVIGSPLPLLGSMFGTFIGALVGTVVGVISAGSTADSRGSLLGLVLAMTMKTAAGVVVAVFTLLILLR
jgi:hypothetical protein